MQPGNTGIGDRTGLRGRIASSLLSSTPNDQVNLRRLTSHVGGETDLLDSRLVFKLRNADVPNPGGFEIAQRYLLYLQERAVQCFVFSVPPMFLAEEGKMEGLGWLPCQSPLPPRPLPYWTI